MLNRFAVAVCLFASAALAQAPPHVPMSAPGYDLGTNTVFNMAGGSLILPVYQTLPATCQTGQAAVAGGKLRVCSNGNTWLTYPDQISTLPGVLSQYQIPATLSANTTGTAALATKLAADPTQCGQGQFTTGVTATGNANCSSIAAGQISGLSASATKDTTAAENILSGVLSSYRLPVATTSTVGAIYNTAPAAHEWIDSFSNTGVPHLSQPSAADIQNLTLGAIANGNDIVKLFGSGHCNGFLKADLTCEDSFAHVAPLTPSGGTNALQFNAGAGQLGSVVNNGSKQFLTQANGASPAFAQIQASDIPAQIASSTSGTAATASALSANPTLCQSGLVSSGIDTHGNAICAAVPASSVSGLAASATINGLNASNINAGSLDAARLPGSVVSSVTNDTNLTGQIQSGALVLSWQGALASNRLNGNVVQNVVSDPNVTGSIAGQSLSLGWTGQLPIARGGTGETNAGAAFNAFSPANQMGDLIYSDGAINRRLPGNRTTTTEYLCQAGTGSLSAAPGWCNIAQSHLVDSAAITTGTIDPARLPLPTLNTVGGVEASAPTSHQFLTGIDNAGVVHQAQPSASDILGLSASATIDTTSATAIVSGTLASARLPAPTPTALGGVKSQAPIAHQFLNGIDTTGAPQFADVHVSDILDFPTQGTTNFDAAAIVSGTFSPARIPAPTANTLGGVKSQVPIAHQFLTGIDTGGSPQFAQPTVADIIGLPSTVTVDTTNASNLQSGTLSAARLPANVALTSTVNQYANQNAPNGNPTGGSSSVWVDTATKNLRVLNDAGTQTVTAQPLSPQTHQFVTGLGANGIFTIAQPDAADITGLAPSAYVDSLNATNIDQGTIGAVFLPVLIGSSTTGNAATAGTFDHTPIICSGGQVATGIDPQGNSTCTSVAANAVTGLAKSATIDTTVASAITSGTLPSARLDKNVATGVDNDINITGAIVTNELELGWQGTLAANRLNNKVVQNVLSDTNVQGSIANQTLTLSWAGVLPASRGGTGGTSKASGFDALSPLTTLGDMLFFNGFTNSRVPGNTTTTTKVLCQTGTGALSAAPLWCTPTAGGGVSTSGPIGPPSPSALGGVYSVNPITHQFMTYIDQAGLSHLAQPTAADVSGLAASATIDTTSASNIGTGTLSATLLPGTITSNTSGNAATATSLASTPAGCATGQYTTGIRANGSANCGIVAYSQVSGAPGAVTNTNQLINGAGFITLATPGIPATNIGTGTVGNTQFGFLSNVASDIQTQINVGSYRGCDGIDASLFGVAPTSGDNSAALAAAFSNAFTTARGIVCLPPGTLLIAHSIDVPDKVQVRGRGRGDAGPVGAGGTNTVIQATPSFPANTPLITIGSLSGANHIAHFGTMISNFSVDCTGIAGSIGIQNTYAEEQSGGHELLISNCPGGDLQINGSDQPSTGLVQNQAGWRDIEIFPGPSALTTTIPLQIINDEEGGGYDRISIVGTSSAPYNYCATVSGNNFHVESIHCEWATVAGILLGPATIPGTTRTTVGAAHITIGDVVMATGAGGVPVEIAYNPLNYPNGLHVVNAAQNLSGSVTAPCGTVKNDFSNTCTDTADYVIGSQVSGSSTILDVGYGNPWQIRNPIQSFFKIQNYNDGNNANLDIKNGSSFLGMPLFVAQNGDLDVGMGGVEGGGGINLHNPGTKLCVDSSANNNCSGINIQGPLDGNFIDAVMGNFYFNPGSDNFSVIGNGTGGIGGLVTLNPAGSLGISNTGGVGIISGYGLSAPATLTPTQMAQNITTVFPGMGGIQMTNPTIAGGGSLPTCAANRDGLLFWLKGASGSADRLETCGKSSGDLYAWTVVSAAPATDIVSIHQFGATGNGTTDDTTAFAAAVASISAPGRSLYLPCGTYKLTSNLTAALPTAAGLTIAGAGVDCVVLNFTTGNGLILTLADQFSSFHLRDFSVATGAGATGTGITVTQTAGNPTPGGIGTSNDIYRVNIRGIDQNHYYSYGFSEVGASNINFDGMTIMGGVDGSGHGTGNGIALAGQTISGTEYGSVVFNVSKSNFNYLANGIIYGSLAQGLTVDQSNFTGDLLGILVPSGLGVPEAPDQLDVTNSQFFDFTAAIAVNSQVNSVNIANNLFGMPAGSNGIVSALLNFSVVGNTFAGAGVGVGGIVLQGSSHGTIMGNNFLGLTTGINMDIATLGVNVLGNSFHGNGTDLANNGTNPTILSPLLKSTTGTRYLCVGTDGTVTASASACSGT